jgi:hypothetical protein
MRKSARSSPVNSSWVRSPRQTSPAAPTSAACSARSRRSRDRLAAVNLAERGAGFAEQVVDHAGVGFENGRGRRGRRVALNGRRCFLSALYGLPANVAVRQSVRIRRAGRNARPPAWVRNGRDKTLFDR